MKSEKKQKKIKKLKNINITLWRSFSLFALLIIVLLAVISYVVVGSAVFDQARNSMRYLGDEVVSNIERVNQPELAPLLDVYIRNTAEKEDADIYILSQEGDIWLPYDAEAPENLEGVVELIRDRMQNIEPGNALIFKSDDSLNYVTRVNYGGGSYLLIEVRLTLVNSTVKTLQTYIVVASLIILVVAFIISYSIAQKLSDPLKSLSATASQLAKGNYDVRFASADYEEIAQLSDTLNYAKDEIKKSETFQKELLANVSHDLKTPLTMIKAYASMIQEISGDNPEKRNQHLQVIIDETDRLAGLVNDVLNVSKISSDIDKINKKVFNLTEFLYGILEKFNYLQETQGYTFMIDIDADLYTCADEEKIGQVIYNLLSNAVNYTGEDKTVYISLKDDPIAARIKFSVRDTGAGIAEEDIPVIWDRFYRVKEDHPRPVKGTGLGLNIVKTILTKHTFDFGVDSKKGEGSTFWIDFPEISSTIDPQ